jgi:hypothetical protein
MEFNGIRETDPHPAQMGELDLKKRVKQPIEATDRPLTADNSILARRVRFPNTFSQLLSPGLIQEIVGILLKAPTRIGGRHTSRRKIASMVVKTVTDCFSRRFRQSSRAPCEGKGTTLLLLAKLPEPQLQSFGYTLDELDFPIRERKVTNGRAESLHSAANPVCSSRSGLGNPRTEYPTTMPLTNATSDKTTPYSLPHSCMGIQLTSVRHSPGTLCRGPHELTRFNPTKKK